MSYFGWMAAHDVLDKLYAEVEDGARLLSLTLVVESSDGTTVSYGSQFDDPTHIARYVLVDQQPLIDALGVAAIDATVDDP